MSLIRNVVTVGGITALSRILGFGRDMAIAAVFGAGVRADAFFVAFQIVNLIRRLLAEGAMNAAVVPLYLRARDQVGERGASAFAGQLIGSLAVMLVVLALLLALGMPLVVLLLAPGFSFGGQRMSIAVELARVMLPYLVLAGPLAVLMAVLNANHRFVLAALATAVFNATMLSALGVIFLLQSGDSEISGRIVAGSIAIAGVAQLVLVGIGTRERVMPLSASFAAPMRRFLRLAIPGLIASGIPQITIIAAVMVASAAPSAVSWLYYANRLIELPLGIVGIAIGTVLVPAFSHALRSGDPAELAAAESRGLEIACFLALPATFGLAVLAEPIVTVLFERGAFTAADSKATAAALTALALGLPGYVLTKALSPIFFAREDTATPMYAALAGFAVALIGSFLLLPGLGHLGVALATGFSGWVTAGVLAVLIVRRFGFSLDRNARYRLPRIAFSAVAMGAALLCLRLALAPWSASPSHLWRLIALGLAIAAGFGVYALLLHLLGAGSLRDFVKAMRRPA